MLLYVGRKDGRTDDGRTEGQKFLMEIPIVISDGRTDELTTYIGFAYQKLKINTFLHANRKK